MVLLSISWTEHSLCCVCLHVLSLYIVSFIAFITFHHDTERNGHINSRLLCMGLNYVIRWKFRNHDSWIKFQKPLNLCRDMTQQYPKIQRKNWNRNKAQTLSREPNIWTSWLALFLYCFFFVQFFWVSILRCMLSVFEWKMQNTSNILRNPVALEFHLTWLEESFAHQAFLTLWCWDTFHVSTEAMQKSIETSKMHRHGLNFYFKHFHEVQTRTKKRNKEEVKRIVIKLKFAWNCRWKENSLEIHLLGDI